MDKNERLIQWLLEEESLPIKYRTMKELLEVPPDSDEMKSLRKKLPNTKEAATIMERMEPGGFWLQSNPRSGEVTGKGVEYGAFATTHFCLAYLSELGIDRRYTPVAQAAERYLDLAAPDGDFWNHMSCLTGYNLRTFALLGYGSDKRVKKAMDLMLSTERQDGGYLCDMHEKKRKKRFVKSCIRGAVKMLLAFAEYPELYDHPRCKALVEYFLGRHGVFRAGEPGTPACKDMTTLTFPITWRADSVQVLYGLSKLGYGRRPELKEAWALLESRADGEGRFPMDWNPLQSPLNPGKRGAPNKWITLYVLLARKFRETVQHTPW